MHRRSSLIQSLSIESVELKWQAWKCLERDALVKTFIWNFYLFYKSRKQSLVSHKTPLTSEFKLKIKLYEGNKVILFPDRCLSHYHLIPLILFSCVSKNSLRYFTIIWMSEQSLKKTRSVSKISHNLRAHVIHFLPTTRPDCFLFYFWYH